MYSSRRPRWIESSFLASSCAVHCKANSACSLFLMPTCSLIPVRQPTVFPLARVSPKARYCSLYGVRHTASRFPCVHPTAFLHPSLCSLYRLPSPVDSLRHPGSPCNSLQRPRSSVDNQLHHYLPATSYSLPALLMSVYSIQAHLDTGYNILSHLDTIHSISVHIDKVFSIRLTLIQPTASLLTLIQNTTSRIFLIHPEAFRLNLIQLGLHHPVSSWYNPQHSGST